MEIKTMSFCGYPWYLEACHGTNFLISILYMFRVRYLSWQLQCIFMFCLIILIVPLYVTSCRNKSIYLDKSTSI